MKIEASHANHMGQPLDFFDTVALEPDRLDIGVGLQVLDLCESYTNRAGKSQRYASMIVLVDTTYLCSGDKAACWLSASCTAR